MRFDRAIGKVPPSDGGKGRGRTMERDLRAREQCVYYPFNPLWMVGVGLYQHPFRCRHYTLRRESISMLSLSRSPSLPVSISRSPSCSFLLSNPRPKPAQTSILCPHTHPSHRHPLSPTSLSSSLSLFRFIARNRKLSGARN